MENKIARSQLLIPLILFLNAGDVDAFGGCRYTFQVRGYIYACTAELEQERRPKLNANGNCARLLTEAEIMNQHFRNGDIELSESCTREDLKQFFARTAEVLSRAKAKGWVTFEEYLKY